MIRGHYWIYGLNGKVSEEELWIVLKDYVDEACLGFKLKEGIVIKLGRCKYTVRELVVDTEADKSFDYTYMDHGENNISVSCVEEMSKVKSEESQNQSVVKKFDDKACRVCLTDENTEDNPLVESPCLCTGSVRFIHIKCLKYWLKSKVSGRRTQYSVSYAWKDFECEVCKMKYPEKFTTSDGKLVEIAIIEKPQTNFMVLELDTKSNSGLKLIHIIFLDRKSCLSIVSNSVISRGEDTRRTCGFWTFRCPASTPR
eukprot:TRINITY_DN6085_c0_g2_i14.p1 TRINITY_DN6085_c0_g2~~TRINITY_DN6085_c0_g2_i14.p1  ORF type:complete len:256 (+),score=25.78 TRINITY_DN6085_c0_g2_i14:401-1168(+)